MSSRSFILSNLRSIIYSLFLPILIFSSSAIHTKIYDCFPFFNELELLEIRLNELYDEVDYFVLVEARESHRGKRKPLLFLKNKHRFKKFLPKIIHITLDNLQKKDNWGRENFQRNAILKGLRQAKADDIIMISDVDEIPAKATLKKLIDPLLTKEQEVTVSGQKMFRFHLNRTDTSVEPWLGTTLCSFSFLKKTSPQILRDSRRSLHLIENTGWHFSSMGGVSRVIFKFANFAHEEVDTKEFNNPSNIKNHINEYPVIPIDSSFPDYILKHQKHYKRTGFIAQIPLEKE